MKLLLSFFILLLMANFSQAEPYPAPNSLFKKIKINPKKWNKKLVAFEGMVIQIEKGPRNKPYFKIKMPQPIMEDIWIASLFDNSINIKKNDIVRVLGYYAVVEKDDPMKNINKEKHHLIGFCMLNISSKKAYFFPPAIKQCQDWKNGIISH